jgi:redox-sensing transcriptional repressor
MVCMSGMGERFVPERISEAVVRRLPRYYRQLGALELAGVSRISSQELSALMNITASQIRQDFSHFGGFGRQGYGYDVSDLRRHIAEILGLDRRYAVILIGAGNIGQALSNYSGFAAEGYDIIAIFDAEPGRAGVQGAEAPVLGMESLEGFVREHRVDIAVIAVPAPAAGQVALRVAKAGVRAVWNFAPVDIVLDGVAVENAQLTDGLMALTYRLGEMNP